MKKLLVLLTVLAMGSPAPAALIAPMIVSLNGEPITPTDYIEIFASEVVDFDIVLIDTTGMRLMSLDALVSVIGLGTMMASMETLTWPYNEGFNDWVWDVPGKQGAVATGSFMAGMGAGILVDHFLLHCDGDDPENDVIITLSNDLRWGGTVLIDGITPYPGAWGSATVHQIEETHELGTCWDPAECAGQPNGDSTCDASIDFADLAALKASFFKSKGEVGYNCCADFDHSNSVDFADLATLKTYFFTHGYVPSTGEQSCPP